MNLTAQVAPGSQVSKKKESITYKIIDAPNHTYGYDIYINGKLAYHQTLRPAVSGNVGFSTKEKAEKVAKLAIAKIKKNQVPPTITIEELKREGVL
jgi:hypothetical protein